jgi:sodium transport system permease protein
MMTVFMLVAPFVGGMNVALDTVAGERERRSLLPLLLNPVPRLDFAIGKWLAVSLFSLAGLTICLLGFAVVLGGAWQLLSPAAMIATFPLAILAAALQVLVSTVSRTVKEAHTWLSMMVFLPMGVGFFMVFFPVAAAQAWCALLPVVGQQIQLQSIMDGRGVRIFEPAGLACLTLALAIPLLRVTANRLRRDEIVFGN